MNKSYSKIRHIKNSNLLLERRYLNEQVISHDEVEKIINQRLSDLGGQSDSCSDEEKLKIENKFKEILLIFPKVIEFWLNWLKNPITKEKYIKQWETNVPEMAKEQGEKYDKMYDYVNSIKLNKGGRCTEFQPPKKSAIAWVDYADKNKVFVNVNLFLTENDSSDMILEILIHELQHIIWGFNKLNFPSKIKKSFISKESGDMNDKVSRIIKSFNLTTEDATILYNFILSGKTYFKNKSAEDEYYIFDPNEKMSRIFTLRKRFDATPENGLEKKSFIPFIQDIVNNSKGNFEYWIKDTIYKKDTDLILFILAWGDEGYKDFDMFLSEINNLADVEIKNQKPSPTDMSYQPKIKNV